QLDKANRNLVLLDAEFIPAAQERIRQLRTEHEALTLELRKQPPSEQDINSEVLTVLQSIRWISWGFRSAAQEQEFGDGFKAGASQWPGLRVCMKEIESITVHTRLTGKGTGQRNTFLNGEVNFTPVGGVNNNLNPHLIA